MPGWPDVRARYASMWTASFFSLTYAPGTVFYYMYSVTVLSVLAEWHAAEIKVLLPLPDWHLPVAGIVLSADLLCMPLRCLQHDSACSSGTGMQ